MSSVALAQVPSSCFSEVGPFGTTGTLDKLSTLSTLQESYKSTLQISQIVGCSTSVVVNKVTTKQFTGMKMVLTDGTSSVALDLTGNIKGQVCGTSSIKAGEVIKAITTQYDAKQVWDVMLVSNKT